MKICFLAIVLLSTSQYAFADATFKFNTLVPGKTQHSLTYYIKAQQLKFTETNSDKSNIFNQKTQTFITKDQKSGSISTLNNELLSQQITHINQKRIQKLVTVEKELNRKLKTMTAIEQQVGESLVNQLKYPDLYGEHTLLTIRPVNKPRVVNKIKCNQYQLLKKKILLKEFCMASPEDIGINQQDYQTLRQFYAFEYKVQSGIMIAGGQTQFSIIDFNQHNMPGVVIETIYYKNNEIAQHQVLGSIDTETLNDAIFNL